MAFFEGVKSKQKAAEYVIKHVKQGKSNDEQIINFQIIDQKCKSKGQLTHPGE